MGEPTTLTYGRRAGRRWKRWTALVIVVAAAAGGYRWRAPILDAARDRWAVARLHWLERGCLTYAPPPDTCVYDDSPAMTATPAPVGDGRFQRSSERFDGSALQSRRTVAMWMPGIWKRCLDRMQSGDPLSDRPIDPRDFEAFNYLNPGSGIQDPPRGIAFLHQRLTPGGRPELICVRVSGGGDLELKAFAWRPGSYLHGMTPITTEDDSPEFGLDLGRDMPSDHVRLFAGQADPGDASRFTIGGDYNGRPFTVVGQVYDGGRVTLRQTSGWAPRGDDGYSPVAGPPHLIAGRDEDLADDTPAIVTWPVANLPTQTVTADDVRFTADGRAVVVLSSGTAVQVGVADGRVAWRVEVPDGAGTRSALSPDGGMAVVPASTDRPTHVVALPSLAVLLEGGSTPGCRVDLGSTVLVEATPHEAVWWDLGRRSVRRRWPTTRTVLAAVPTGFGRSVVITGATTRPAATSPTAEEEANGQASPDLPTLETAASLFDATADEPTRSIPTGPTVDGGFDPYWAGWEVVPTAVSPDGHFASLTVTNGSSGDETATERTVDLWAGRTLRDGPVPGGKPQRVRFSPDGHLMAWSNGLELFVLDAPAKCIHRLNGTNDAVIAFSPDGRTMAGVWDGAVHVWPTPANPGNAGG